MYVSGPLRGFHNPRGVSFWPTPGGEGVSDTPSPDKEGRDGFWPHVSMYRFNQAALSPANPQPLFTATSQSHLKS